MPEIFDRKPKAETVRIFFARTDPTDYPGAVIDEIGDSRRGIESRGHKAPSSEILLARKLAQTGAEHIKSLEEAYFRKPTSIFPGGNGYLPGEGFNVLEPSDQMLVKQSWAAIILGVSVEALSETFDNPSSGPALFSRERWKEIYVNATSRINFPEVRIDQHLPITSERKQPNSDEEIITPENANIIRDYIKATDLHDAFTYYMWRGIPTSLQQFIQDAGEIKDIILGSGKMAEKFHERAVALTREDKLFKTFYPPNPTPDAKPPETKMPDYMLGVSDWDFTPKPDTKDKWNT